ncbi:MAG: hypothetical protein ABI809_14050, partial [Caldimonas sp.]
LEDLTLGRDDLAHAVHRENILRHGYMALRERSERRPPKAGSCFAKTYCAMIYRGPIERSESGAPQARNCFCKTY